MKSNSGDLNLWIALNNSFLSIVENRNNSSELLVRARVKGDIERVFSEAETFEDLNADYRYRALIERDLVAKAVASQVSKINYDNFKNSISKDEYRRHDAYLQVWGNLRILQY